MNNRKISKHSDNCNKLVSLNRKMMMESQYISNKKAYFHLKTFNNDNTPIIFESTYSMKGGGCGDETIDDGTGSCGGNKSYD